jgi:quinol monooxygenase YgiN
MIIVGGTFEVEPADREQFIADRLALMRVSRAEKGCLDYAFCADPLEPGRVLLYERWESQDDLNAHFAGMSSWPPAGDVSTNSVSLVFYDAEAQRPVGA